MPATTNEEDQISELLSQQQIDDLSSNDIAVSVCANCGKEGRSNLNICNKCKETTYCNAACKKKHRSRHKKECEKRVAELHDEALFKEPPSRWGLSHLLYTATDVGYWKKVHVVLWENFMYWMLPCTCV